MRLDVPVTKSAPDRTGWGVLSTGHIASVFARDLALLPDEAELVAVGSRSQGKADEFAAAHGFARSHGSYAELAADPGVDVVYVASVHNDHAASARLCLEAGKAVLVEKPLTVTAADAQSLLDLAGKRRLFCMEAVWNRTNPLIRHAAETVRSGELGPVRHLTASFGFAFRGGSTHRLLDPGQAGGAILDLGVYPVHAAQLFLGEPTDVHAYGDFAATGVDSHAAALLTYPATPDRPAATAAVATSLETTLPTRLDVLCAEGSIALDNFVRPTEMMITRTGGEPETVITQLPGGGYTFEAQEVMRCLQAGEIESPLVPWADTLACLRTMERWRAGIQEGDH